MWEKVWSGKGLGQGGGAPSPSRTRGEHRHSSRGEVEEDAGGPVRGLGGPQRTAHPVPVQREANEGPCTVRRHAPINFDEEQSGCLGTVDWTRLWQQGDP